MTEKTAKTQSNKKTKSVKKRQQSKSNYFSEEIAIQICEAIASSTDTLEVICQQNPHFPTPRAIHLHKHKDADFRSMYMSAKSAQSDILVEQLRTIYNDPALKNGLENVAVARLQIDTIKWLASRLLPRLYGNKLDLAESVNKEELAQLTETVNKLAKSYEREY